MRLSRRRQARLRRALTTVLAVVLAVPAAVGAVGAGVGAEAGVDVALEPRGSILIEGDGELASHSAVREGSGTAEDPYRIHNWTVVPTASAGIDVRNTRAHVEIESIHVPKRGAAATWGISLVNSTNVSIENVVVQGPSRGIEVTASESIQIDGPALGSQVTERRETMEFGFLVIQSENVEVSNVTVPTADDVGLMDQSARSGS